MHTAHISLLRQLETELSRTVLPAVQSDMARQIAQVAACLIGRWIIEETAEPQLRREAIDALRALMDELRAKLEPSLSTAIDQCLTTFGPETWSRLEAHLQEAVTVLISSPDVASRRLAARMVGVDATFREKREFLYQERMRVSQGISNGYDLRGLKNDQIARLLTFIRRRFPNEEQVSIARIKAIPGGFSKQTLFIDLKCCRDLPASIVMRRDAPYPTSATLSSVRQEYPILLKMHGAGIPGPQPIALEETGDVLGTPFMLTSRVYGHNGGNYLHVAEQNPALANDLARQIAAIHAVPIGNLEQILNPDRKSVRERVVAEIEHHDKLWSGLRHYRSYTIGSAITWLKQNVDLVDGRRVVVHRDIGLHNILICDDRVSGFFDWENSSIGNPTEDIGYVSHAIQQLGDWGAFLCAYESASGVTLDPRQIDYFTLFGDMRVAVGLALVADAVMSGEVNNIQHLYVGEYFTQVTAQRMARKLSEVLCW